MDTAVAALEFNKGSSGFISVLENLSFHSEHHFMTYISVYISLYSSLTPLERERYEGEVQPHRKTDYKPIIYISTRKRRASRSTKKRILSRKLFKAGIADQMAAKERCSL